MNAIVYLDGLEPIAMKVRVQVMVNGYECRCVPGWNGTHHNEGKRPGYGEWVGMSLCSWMEWNPLH